MDLLRESVCLRAELHRSVGSFVSASPACFQLARSGLEQGPAIASAFGFSAGNVSMAIMGEQPKVVMRSDRQTEEYLIWTTISHNLVPA
jgi:hypothetical protein